MNTYENAARAHRSLRENPQFVDLLDYYNTTWRLQKLDEATTVCKLNGTSLLSELDNLMNINNFLKHIGDENGRRSG